MKLKEKSDFRYKKATYISYNLHPGCLVRGEIWLEKDGSLYLNAKRVALLSLIDKFGSLTAAARSIGVTYNTAWLWVEAMNRLSSSQLVKRSCGGANGGYSVLTSQGKMIVAEYDRFNRCLKETIKQIATSDLNTEMNPSERTLISNMEVANAAIIDQGR